MHQEWQRVQETVQSWEYDDDNYLFVFGDEVSTDVQRRETHSCTDRGTSRSECQCGYVSELTTRITAPLQFSIVGSSIEQCGYKKVHWKKRDLVGEMKEIGCAIV